MTQRMLIGAIALLPCITAPATVLADDARLAQITTFFADATVIAAPALVDCTLSGGTETTCFQITVAPTPPTHETGPWCPTNISDGPEAGGIWFLDGETVDVDGDFIQSLATIYGDTKWQLFDPDSGDIRFTGTLEACEAAARPDVAPEYQNHCVQCLPEYMPDDTSITYVIPLEPVLSDRPNRTNQSGSGIAFNGGRLDGPAPVDAILGAYTIAAFDDCGGHVNPNVGYHYHAVTDCLEANQKTSGPMSADEIAAAGLGPQIGIAMDGFQIFARLMADGSEPTGLDACNGRMTEDGQSYYYHAGEAGSNAILGCLAAEVGCTLNDAGGTCDASQRPARP